MKDERIFEEGFSRRGLIKTLGMGGLAIAASGGLGLHRQRPKVNQQRFPGHTRH